MEHTSEALVILRSFFYQHKSPSLHSRGFHLHRPQAGSDLQLGTLAKLVPAGWTLSRVPVSPPFREKGSMASSPLPSSVARLSKGP